MKYKLNHWSHFWNQWYTKKDQNWISAKIFKLVSICNLNSYCISVCIGNQSKNIFVNSIYNISFSFKRNKGAEKLWYDAYVYWLAVCFWILLMVSGITSPLWTESDLFYGINWELSVFCIWMGSFKKKSFLYFLKLLDQLVRILLINCLNIIE